MNSLCELGWQYCAWVFFFMKDDFNNKAWKWQVYCSSYFRHQVEVESRHSGWVSCCLPSSSTRVVRLELKGPDNSLRLRQVKLLGEVDGASLAVSGQRSPLVMQQQNCEAETLKVFRLLTSQVSLDTKISTWYCLQTCKFYYPRPVFAFGYCHRPSVYLSVCVCVSITCLSAR